MSNNFSVTDHEYELKDGVSIISTTDLRGRITYANAAFIEASGYSEDELIGKPHNLVRHPDMPREAFADLWETLGEGQAWTGMVKNRRKNGDYYWVLANVTPLRKTLPTKGYLSVRNKPSRAQIAETERLYQQINSGNAAHLIIRHGKVTRRGWPGVLTVLRRIPIGIRIMLTASFAAILMAALGMLGWWETASQPQLVGVPGWLPLSLAVAGGMGGLLLLLFGYFISSTILKPIDRALEVAHAIAWGNLSTEFEINASDETGQLLGALNQMKTNLVAVMSEVGSHVHGISTEAKGIAELSSRIQSGTTQLGQAAENMEKLTNIVRAHAEHNNAMNQSVASASPLNIKDKSENIGEIVQQLATMEEQMLAATLALQQEVGNLEQAVHVFKLDDI
jgi:aerotaxis receptor